MEHNTPTKAAQDKLLQKVVLAGGDLTGLTADEKYEYTKLVAHHSGLGDELAPFKIIRIDNREVLYADKGTAEMLRKRNGLSLLEPKSEVLKEAGVLKVTFGITDGDRTDYDCGVVSIVGLTGEAYANAEMAAHTKGKRRVTLSFVGLGIIDEAEFDTIQGAMSKQEVSENGLQVSEKKVEKAKAIEKSAKELNATKEPTKEPAQEEPAIDLNALVADIDTVPAKELAARLDDYFQKTRGHDSLVIFDDAHPRKPTTVKAMLKAIAEDGLEAHLKEKYPHYKAPKGKAKESAPAPKSGPDLSSISEPGNDGRDMPAAVKLADFMEKQPGFDEQKILDLYPDNFNDIEDFYKFASLEQIRIALQ